MSGAINGGVPGNLWETNSQGIATPQVGRPAMTGGLQPLAMLQAYRAGATMDQLQAMNPYTMRPAQYLPAPIATTNYAPPIPALPSNQMPLNNTVRGVPLAGGPGGGDGSVGSTSSDGGQDGSSAAAGGGGGGGSK